MEIFLIKSGISISVLYIFYWLLLRNETFHNLNRIFILFSLFLSFTFPLYIHAVKNISAETIPAVSEPIIIKVQTGTALVSSSNSLSILSIIYISGAVFMVLRFLSNMAKLHFLYYRYPRFRFNGFMAVVLDKNQSPFTFFNILFISKNDFENGKIDEMIVHEQAHQESFHSFDVLLLEIMSIIQWFNPFLWLFRYSLKAEHEFIADDKVLKKGFDLVGYQKLLFEKSLGITNFEVTNNFNYSLLKKRLKMMTINKSGTVAKLKYILTLPILISTFFLVTLNVSIYSQDEKVYKDVDVQAKYKNENFEGIRNYFAQNIKYPKSAEINKISAKIYVHFIVNEKSKVQDTKIVRSDILDNAGEKVIVKEYDPTRNPEINAMAMKDIQNEAIRVVNSLTDLTPAIKDGKNVKTEYVIPIQFVLGAAK